MPMNLGTFFGMVLECQEFQNSHRSQIIQLQFSLTYTILLYKNIGRPLTILINEGLLYFKSSKNINSQKYGEELSRNVLRCFRVSKIFIKT